MSWAGLEPNASGWSPWALCCLLARLTQYSPRGLGIEIRHRSYTSIPQRNKTLQQLSIRSLALYASIPDAFIVIAPPTIHSDSQLRCDAETYQRRGWCRLEQWARLTVGGPRLIGYAQYIYYTVAGA